jgi:hypothetical protein
MEVIIMDKQWNYIGAENDLLTSLVTVVSKCPIKSNSNNNNEFGLMIEKMINIDSNELPVADYNGIEIKCRKINSAYALKLFTCIFESDRLFELNYLFNNYANNNANGKKSFNHSFFANKYTKINCNCKAKLCIDYNNKKVFLCFFNNVNQLIYKECYWTFDLLKKRIDLKLNYLCIITYKQIYQRNEKYYIIVKINFYKIKGFTHFLSLLNEGKIFISTSIAKENNYKGEEIIHNHGIGFCIDYINIDKLFDSYKSIEL